MRTVKAIANAAPHLRQRPVVKLPTPVIYELIRSRADFPSCEGRREAARIAKGACGTMNMNNRLDEAIRQLRDQEIDRRLDQLEPQVWRRIEARRRGAPAGALLPIRAGMTAAALALGVAVGGAAAASAMSHEQEISVFSVQPRLAPSTLLDGHA